MQLFGVLLCAVACALAAPQLPLKLENVDVVRSDPMWIAGKSKVLSIGNLTFSNGIAEGEEPNACKSTFSCLDCITARLCRQQTDGSYTELYQMQCPPERPYCNVETGSCSSTADASCGEDDGSFTCTKDGYFPDPSKSTIYHVCKDHVAHKFECSVSGEVFNAVTGLCVTSDPFVPFDCDEMASKVPYHLSNNYYAYCTNGNIPPIIVDKCPGSTKLNVTSQKCEVICDTAGVFPDVEDCNKYYKCELSWLSSTSSVIIKTRNTCPTGTSFTYVDNMCIESGTNQYCATNLQ